RNNLCCIIFQAVPDVGRIARPRARMHQRARLVPAPAELDEHRRRVAVRPDLLALGHRSTPPITGSMLATAAITSATMPPSLMAATDCRLVNEGSRKCARNGLVPPSLTAWQPSSPRGDSTAAYT